jgi:transposase, IS5 family
VAKRAAIMVGRYTHAHQFKRARRELKFLRTRLGRIIRDIRRKIAGNPALEDRFGPLRMGHRGPDLAGGEIVDSVRVALS